MLHIKNEYLVVLAIGLLGIFMDMVPLIAVNFVVALICALFCMKKGLYIHFVAGVKFCSVF